jgi:chromosome segregation ATPase
MIDYKETHDRQLFELTGELKRLSLDFSRLCDKNNELEQTVFDLHVKIGQLETTNKLNQERLVAVHAGMLASSQEIIKTEYRVQSTEYRVQGTEYRVQSTEYRAQGTGYRVQGTGYRVQSTGYRVQSTEYRVQSTEYRVQSTEYRVQGTEYRVQRRSYDNGGLVGDRARYKVRVNEIVFRDAVGSTSQCGWQEVGG